MSSKQVFDHAELLEHVENETLVPINEVSNVLPTWKCPATVQRWIRVGVNGVKLATIKIGGRRYTTKTAIREFLHAQQKTAPEPARSESRKGMSKKMIADLSKKYGLPEPK